MATSANSLSNPTNNRGTSLTFSEYVESTNRVASHALAQLTIGPLSAISTGLVAVYGVGLVEGFAHVQSSGTSSSSSCSVAKGGVSKATFAARYALAQVLPSVIWGTQDARLVASHIGFDKSQLWTTQQRKYPQNPKMPEKLQLRIGGTKALRGAIAGSILLSQVLSVTTVLQQSRQQYSQKVQEGKEPPLQSGGGGGDGCGAGVVIRLAGKESDVTSYSMSQMGRRHLWPIFEDSQKHHVQSLVNHYGIPTINNNNNNNDTEVYDANKFTLPNSNHSGITKNTKAETTIPVYWQVNNGQYSHPDSWKGMFIPSNWLFQMKQQHGQHKYKQPLLILEADSTFSDGSSLAMAHYSLVNHHDHEAATSGGISTTNNSTPPPKRKQPPQDDNSNTPCRIPVELDLDLKEAAQGFHRLAQMSPHNNTMVPTITSQSRSSANSSSAAPVPKQDESDDPQVLRVLLVDEEALVESGGGRPMTLRNFVQQVQLADVTIDARSLIVRSVLEWLQTHYKNNTTEEEEEDEHNTTSTSQNNELLPVILETHSKEWFQSIQYELRKHGYQVMDIFDVKEHNGSSTDNNNKGQKIPSSSSSSNNIPMLVYERTGADTISTIRAFLKANMIQPSNVCALLSSHDGLQHLQEFEDSCQIPAQQVGRICSAEIYHKAFAYVRQEALEGTTIQDIQRQMDTITKTELDHYLEENLTS